MGTAFREERASSLMLVVSFVDFLQRHILCFVISFVFILVLLSAILFLCFSSSFFNFFFSFSFFFNNVCGSFPIKCYTIEVSGV